MTQITKILAGAAIGALAMYFYDPNRGKKRRAMVVDKADRACRDSSRFLDRVAQDAADRVDETVSGVRSALAKGSRVTREALASVSQ